ncbi:chromosome partitioning protein ParB [Paracoccus sp. MBLB3053]|uniref:Chromosome partitioning protein ParB n=1 Tax=Paracoccus aurantius TaxID=3073814 RepID=A0ABU2HYN4_9RHOB|nr:chromosome partitioning protein ParB [Paracoccus sp. MBLB3053]MDS9469605.1 chromosome partitioning protein ParB [Paracoccus sp. MBLB3053]
MAENAARRDLHPADEIRAYGKMTQSGAPVSTIARAFAVSEKHVQRRLALAGLPDAVIAALAANEISLGMAAAFTISMDAARSLEVLELCKSRDWSEHQIRRALKPEAVKSSDRRACFVGLEAYQAAGGRVSRDLFAEDVLLDDPDILDTVSTEKLAALAESYRDEGWKWVETSLENYIGYYQIEEGKFARLYKQEGALSEDEAARFDELTALEEAEALDAKGREELAALQAILEGRYSEAQKAHSGLILYVDPRGAALICAGLVRKEDKAAAIAAGLLTASQHEREDASKSPISQKLREDLDRVAQGARQHAILRDPELLFDLLAFQLSHALHWQKPFGISLGEVPNWPTTGAEGYALDPRLAEHPARDMQGKDLAKSFRAFRQKGSEYIRGELTRFLAAQYQGGEKKLTALVEKEVQPRTREIWTPNAANFFSRVSGPYLSHIWSELLDLAEDAPSAVAFDRFKKAEKAAQLESLFSDAATREALGVSKEQASRIANWLPEGMS